MENNGANVAVWKDAWLPRDSGMLPFTPDFINMSELTVSGLISEGQWDVDLVRTIFWDIDASVILQIPLPVLSMSDRRIWHYSLHGHYTVKIAYLLARRLAKQAAESRRGTSSHSVPVNWDWVWQLEVPPKFSPGEWLDFLKSKLSKAEMEVFLMSCWSLWSNRNMMVHEGDGYDAAQMVYFFNQTLEYKEAQAIFSAPRPPEGETVGAAPSPRRIKINFDAAVQGARGMASGGVVARDHHGTVLAWHRFPFPYQINPVVAEAFAGLAAVRLAHKFRYTHVDIEGDCLKVIQQLGSKESSFEF